MIETTETTLDATAEKILNAATTLFIDKGFDATSISQIAKLAKVTQSLIFHHFKNKANLWCECKNNFLMSKNINIQAEHELASQSLDNFLELFVTKRFRFYQENPMYVRFMTWQCISKDTYSILSACQNQNTNNSTINSALNAITMLQRNKHITDTLSPQCVLAFIANLTNGYFIKNMSAWMTAAQEKEYIRVIKQQTRQLLEPQDPS
jgi:AcrR family transcriptional regulator